MMPPIVPIAVATPPGSADFPGRPWNRRLRLPARLAMEQCGVNATSAERQGDARAILRMVSTWRAVHEPRPTLLQTGAPTCPPRPEPITPAIGGPPPSVRQPQTTSPFSMSKAQTQPPKGTRDFLPEDLRRRHYVTGVIREVFECHGFSPLETPALERLDALMGKYGEEGDQLLFKVLLRGQPLVQGIRSAADHIANPAGLIVGRSGETAPGAEPMLADLGLRYDLTVPLARVVAAHQGKLPTVFKRYQIQPVWRADTPGKGRFREFYQCDVDVVGSDSRLVEAEVTAAAAVCLHRLGFKEFALRLNHRGLLRALVERSGIDVGLEGETVTAIDKLGKIGVEGVAAELAQRGIDAQAAKTLLSLLAGELTLDRVADFCAGHAGGEAAVGDLRALLSLAAGTAAGPHLHFDATLARGMGYYTGCIFEIAVPDLAGSLGGGGRYDGLIGMFQGRDVPACGLSLGLERILVVMEDRSMYPSQLNRPILAIGVVADGEAAAALKLAATLRAAGLAVDLRPGRVKPGKLKKFADEQGMYAALWFEANQADRVCLWLKDQAGDQDLPVSDVLARLQDASS